MRQLLLLSLFVMILTQVRVNACSHNSTKDCKSSNSSEGHVCTNLPSVCWWEGSDRVNKKFTPPPTFLKNGSQKKSEFAVIKGAFPSEEADIAFDYAISIWENTISSGVPLSVYVEWSRYLPSGALAGCYPLGYKKIFNDPFLTNTLYPFSLFHKINYANEEFVPDMSIKINSNLENWYFGTDGNTPEGSYDFVTVILHELAHGLGMQGTCNNTGSAFEYNKDIAYSVFDRFLEDEAGNKIDDRKVYPKGSDELFHVLRDSLIFNGEKAKAANNGERVSLYAPDRFMSGSSVYHLSEGFKNDDENSLLFYQLDLGRAIHSPGPVLLGILNDMGWDVPDLIHVPTDTDDPTANTKEINFKLSTAYNLGDVKVFYKKTGEGVSSYLEAPITHNGGDSYSARLENLVYGNDYGYYIEINDILQGESRNFSYPLTGLVKPKNFTFGVDELAPYIIDTDTKPSIKIPYDYTFDVTAYADDNYEIDNVSVVWTIDGVQQENVILQLDSEIANVYSGEVTVPETVSGKAEIEYWVVATDKASTPNSTSLPAADAKGRVVDVTEYKPLIGDYYTNFDTVQYNNLVSTNVEDDFHLYGMKILKPSNDFQSKSLNSEHPYSLDSTYIANFAYEITVKNGTKISYDEIVIVEESKDGYTFPSYYFYDYVAVEASLDQGETWEVLDRGYDCGEYEPWRQLWSSWLETGDNQPPNSYAFPKPNLYVNKEIDIVNDTHFEEGDEIIIRFVLASDNIIYGWGWSIDNLSIKYEEPDVSVKTNHMADIQIAPNPVTNHFMIQSAGLYSVDIYSVTGSKLQSISTYGFTPIYVADLTNGVYIVKIKGESGSVTKKLLKQ